MDGLRIDFTTEQCEPACIAQFRRSLQRCLEERDPPGMRSADDWVEQLVETLALLEESAEMVQQLPAALDRKALEAVIDTLPPRGHITLDLHEFEDLSSAAIAACLQIRHSLARKEGRLILANVGEKLRSRLVAMHLAASLGEC